ncbi:MAG: hypothetical protein RL514_1052 [Verrucomicrobiota bacterium]|jgi:hypothetical protein
MRFPFVLGLVCFSALAALAQAPRTAPGAVELQIKIDQTLVLPGEVIVVEIALRNLSGRPLVFTPSDDWLNLNVYSITKQTGEGVRVTQFKPALVNEAFILENAKSIKTRVEISKLFALMQPGRYKLTASAEYRGMAAPAAAEPQIFQITSGARLWEQEFGVRTGEGEGAVEGRKYLVQRLTNLKDQRLYATLMDASDGTILQQIRLGRSSASDNPQAKLDRLSYLHVLHQADSRLFTHTVINPAGDVLRRETFESLGPRPGLRLDEEGRVGVFNGVRRPRADDLPPMQPAPAVPAPAQPPAKP